jgi:hypothetical protein
VKAIAVNRARFIEFDLFGSGTVDVKDAETRRFHGGPALAGQIPELPGTNLS